MKLRRVYFRDESATGLRWMGGLPLPAKGTHYAGRVFPLAERVADLTEALHRQINEGLYRPPLAYEHMPGPVALGCVRRVRVLSLEEATALGIEQRHPHEVYFGCDITDPALADAYDAGQVLYGSPELRGELVDSPYTDETGAEWPVFVGEFSVVAIPHNKSQVPADRLRGVTMGDGARRMGGSMDMDALKQALAVIAAFVEQHAPEASSDVQDVAEVVADAIAAEVAADVAGGGGDAPEPDMADAPEDEEQPAVMSELRRLRREVARMAAEKRVDEALRSRTFGDLKRDELVQIAMRDGVSWNAIVRAAAKRPSVQPRAAVSGASGKPAAPALGTVEMGDAIMRRVKVLMGEGLNGPEALIRARRELGGAA